MNALEVILGDMLAGAARLALSLDQDHRQYLAQLEGQSLRIHCTNPPQRVTLRVTAGQLDILPGSENPTDATVIGPLTDLITLLRGGSPGTALRVNGNPTVLRDFARLFENYDPDLSALIPEGLRDTVARPPFAGTSATQGAELFEQLRGVAEVGIASIGKALQSALSGDLGPMSAGVGQPFAGQSEFSDFSARLQSLQHHLNALSERIDDLDRSSNKPP